MSKASKIFERLQSAGRVGGSLTFREFDRLLRAFGFRHERTTGSHRQYVHPRVPWVFTVNPDGTDARRYQVRQLLDMIDTYELSIEE